MCELLPGNSAELGASTAVAGSGRGATSEAVSMATIHTWRERGEGCLRVESPVWWMSKRASGQNIFLFKK